MIAVPSLAYWGAGFEYAVLAALVLGFSFVTSALFEVTATLEENRQDQSGKLVIRGVDQEDIASQLTAVLLDPDARKKLTRAAQEGRSEVSAEQWAEITHDLRNKS